MQKSFRKHNLKLAIFLSYREATEGGGFTITDDILNEILKTYKKNNIIFILLNDKKNFLKKKIAKAGFKYKVFYENKITIKIKNFVFSLFPFLFKIYNNLNLNPFLNFQKKNNINLVWFLSAEYYFPLFSKYISTVWDLQHLTHPKFPENGNLIRRFYRGIVIKNFLKNSHRIITGSSILIKIMKKEYNISSKKFIYNKHPTPNLFVKFKKQTKKIKNLNNFFLYPANFWQHKNHLNLFEGFKRFNKKNKDKYKLVLVGDIKDKNYYNQLIRLYKKKDIENSFKILNFVTISFLIRLYDNCLAIIYSSYAGPENLPPLEAMARKKNIICSIYPGAKEQLKNIPIYFNPNSPVSIERALNIFIKTKRKKQFFVRSTSNYIHCVLKNIHND